MRFDYGRIHVLLNRDSYRVGKNLVYRLYREERLGLRQRPPKRHQVAVKRGERFKSTAPNQAWSLDFVCD